MAVYIFVFLAMFLFYWISYSSRSRDPKKKFLVWTAILLIIVLGSRHSQYSFADEGVYYNLYKGYIGRPFSSVEFEIMNIRDSGFFLLTWFLAQIIQWPQFFLYFESAFIIIPLFWLIYKNSDNPFLVVTALFGTGLLSFCLSAFRQAMAISLCLVAYSLTAQDGNYKRGLAKQIIGITMYVSAIYMHRSALVFIVVVIVNSIKSVSFKVLSSVAGAAVVLLFREELFRYGSDLLEKGYNSEFHMSLIGHLIQLIVLSTPVLLLLLSHFFSDARYRQLHGDYSLMSMTNAAFIAILACVFYASRTFAQAYERIAYYFYPFTALTYSTANVYAISKNSKRASSAFLSILCILLFLWRIRYGLRGGAFTFFWQ